MALPSVNPGDHCAPGDEDVTGCGECELSNHVALVVSEVELIAVDRVREDDATKEG